MPHTVLNVSPFPQTCYLECRFNGWSSGCTFTRLVWTCYVRDAQKECWKKTRCWLCRPGVPYQLSFANRSPAQVGCMRQALGPGALGKPRGSGWRGRWEWGSGWGTHVNPWLFHFSVWQNSLQKKNLVFKKQTCMMFHF